MPTVRAHWKYVLGNSFRLHLIAALLVVVGLSSLTGCGADMGFPINVSASIAPSVLAQGGLHQIPVGSMAPTDLGSASIGCYSVSRNLQGGPTAVLFLISDSMRPPNFTLHVGESHTEAGIGEVTLVSISSSGGTYSVEVLVRLSS